MDPKDGGEVSNQRQESVVVYTRFYENAIKLKEIVGQLGEDKEKLREFGDDLKEYASSFKVVIETLGEKEEKIKDQAKTLEQLENELHDTRERLGKKIQELDCMVGKKDEEINWLKHESIEKDNKVGNLKQELQTQQQRCSDQVNEIGKLKQELETQQQRCSERDNEIEMLKQEIQGEETQRQRTGPEIYSGEGESTIPLISETPDVEVRGRNENESVLARRILHLEMAVVIATVVLLITSGCFGILIELHANVKWKNAVLITIGAMAIAYVAILVTNRFFVVKFNGANFCSFQLAMESTGIVLTALVTIGTGLNSEAQEAQEAQGAQVDSISMILASISCAANLVLAISGAKASWPH